MNKALIIILAILSVSPVRADEIVKKIIFHGDKPGSGITLFNKPGETFEPDSLTSDSLKIVDVFQKRGWFDCQVIIDVKRKAGGVNILYSLDKKDRYLLYINLNDITGKKDFADDIDAVIAMYNKKPAVSSHMDNLADEIIKIYGNNGYPYCELRATDLTIQKPHQLELTLDIQPGPKVTVEMIDFAGRKYLNSGFLQTYTGLRLPLTYSTEKLALVQRHLSAARFLDDAGDFQLRYSKSPESGLIIFPIKEVSPLVIDGAVGYSSKNNDFYGRFGVVISNILGKGRQARLNWAKKDKSSRWLKIGFSEPNPLGMPFRLDLEAYQDDRDSLYIENGGAVGLYYISSDIYSYGAAVGASRINPESYGKTFLPFKEKLKLSVSFTADTRDYRDNPRKGDYFCIEGVFASEKIKGNDDFAASSENYRTVGLKIGKYFPLTRTSTLFCGLAGEGDFSDDVPPDRQFPLGGYGSLRGYRQDIFFVSRVAIVTIEYRLLTSRRGRAYIFSDMALFQMPKSTGENNFGSQTEFRAGFGVGLAAPVTMGLATIEIAVPHDEDFSSAKLHFGIKAGF